jgi:hypothetical protein
MGMTAPIANAHRKPKAGSARKTPFKNHRDKASLNQAVVVKSFETVAAIFNDLETSARSFMV